MGVAVNSHAYSAGQKIDIEYEGNFYIAKIMAVNNGYLYLRYEEWGPEFDEWLAISSPRVRAPPGVIQSFNAVKKVNAMELWGNQTTFNIEKVLHQNILASEYFKSLFALKTYNDVVNEIYRECDTLEPWASQLRVPSTAYCLLLKFFSMGLTEKQIVGLLDHTDSPYIRGVGFLYLRYACPPKRLWEFFSSYLDDEEEIILDKMQTKKTTIGGLVRMLLQESHYCGSIMPRIPVPVMRDIQKKLLMHERGISDEAEEEGERDDEGRSLDAERKRSRERRGEGDSRRRHRSGSRDASNDRDGRQRGSSREKDDYYKRREVERDVEREIKERMRSQASAMNRNDYMRRPPSVKSALSVKSTAVNMLTKEKPSDSSRREPEREGNAEITRDSRRSDGRERERGHSREGRDRRDRDRREREREGERSRRDKDNDRDRRDRGSYRERHDDRRERDRDRDRDRYEERRGRERDRHDGRRDTERGRHSIDEGRERERERRYDERHSSGDPDEVRKRHERIMAAYGDSNLPDREGRDNSDSIVMGGTKKW
mmetsp:Transcript_21454/g.55757  ORF Transcript_21454/g.55757 Transcript_21454/m.55757 type:complete len:543 (-) Transcript_21454:126-1754(-)